MRAGGVMPPDLSQGLSEPFLPPGEPQAGRLKPGSRRFGCSGLFAALGDSEVKRPVQEVGLSSGSLVLAAQMGASRLRYPVWDSTFALGEGNYRPTQEDNHKIP